MNDPRAWHDLFMLTGTAATSAAFLAPLPPHELGAIVVIAPLLATPYGIWRLRFFTRQHHEERLEAALIVTDEAYGPPPIAAAACVLIACAVRNSWMTVVYLLESRSPRS